MKYCEIAITECDISVLARNFMNLYKEIFKNNENQSVSLNNIAHTKF